jgi:hypothetical protein
MISKKCLRYVVALCIAAASVQATIGQQLSQPPRDGVLLLKHGTTLSGFIAPAGDRYIVLLGESGEARVPVADVVAFVSNLQQAYEYKRSNLKEDLASRIDLAQWCLQQNMPARAADQLLAAELLFGRQPQLESLHQRLIVSAKTTGLPGSVAVEARTIAKASFEEPLDSFPSRSIDTFTSAVQPLLLNRCAAGGCHNTRGSSEYVLFRPFLGQATTQRLTEQNLKATLAYVNRTAPLESILLQRAALAHGGAVSAGIQEKEQRQFELLSVWLHSLAAGRRSSEPNTIAPANELLYQPSQLSNTESTDAPDVVPASRLPKETAKPMGDPFDPAPFNQQHHGRTH